MPSSPSPLVRGVTPARERASQSPVPYRELETTPDKKGRKGVLRTKEAIPRSPLGRESPGP
jgi:hypothetical protein